MALSNPANKFLLPIDIRTASRTTVAIVNDQSLCNEPFEGRQNVRSYAGGNIILYKLDDFLAVSGIDVASGIIS